jgi:hypothetical protein
MSQITTLHALLSPISSSEVEAVAIGFRIGSKGTHSSRTMMLAELDVLFRDASCGARRTDYRSAIVEGNCLSKATTSTRRITNQRLGELYGLDPTVALFRILCKLWKLDSSGRPLLALLAALARDPLLAATCSAIIDLPIESDLQRNVLKDNLRAFVGERMNDRSLEKVCRNVASSWTQSGHLKRRSRKVRQAVSATPACVAFAMYLAHAAGFRGLAIWTSMWLRILDCTPSEGRSLALEAKRLGLLDVRILGNVVELDFSRLDPGLETS